MFVLADVTIGEESISKIIKLGNAGLIYTAPNKIGIVSDLDILSTKAASAAIGLEVPYNVSIGAQVSLVDSYKVFDLGGRTLPNRTRAPLFSAGARDDGTGHLLFFMSASAEARVQVPPMPNPPLPQPGPFIYGLAQAAGVKFPIVVAKLGVGFDYPPGAFSADVSFPIVDTVNIIVESTESGILAQVGTKFGSLPPITFAPGSTYVTAEQTAHSSRSKGPVYLPGSEGLHVMQTYVSAPLDLGSYTVPANAPHLAFDLSAGASSVRYDLTKPDGTVINPDNATANNAVFLQNVDLNESYYVVSNPDAGTWSVQAEDGSQGPFVLNVFGANAPPVLTSVSAAQTGTSVQINYNATDPDDNAPVSLFYTKSSTDFTGTPIVQGLPMGTSGSYNWNIGTGSVPTGDYYVFAMISDGKNVPQTKFAPTKITVVDPQAPATPQGVMVKATAGNSLLVSWTPNTDNNLQGYNILYAVDLGDGTVLNLSFDAGDQTSFRLPRLANNTPYRVSVVADSQTSIPDPNHPGNNIVTTHTSAPSPVQTATTGMASPPIVQVTSPNGGEQITGNDDVSISWHLAQDGDVVNQKIEVSTDDGANYTPITQILDKTARNFVWHAPTTLHTTTARVRVTALDSSGNTGSDTNDAVFTISPQPTPTPTPTPAVLYGDVAPRPDGDGSLLSADVIVERKFIVGTLVPDANEFIRADCAPKATHGDGILSAGDTIQVRRYVAGVDTQGTIETSAATTDGDRVDSRSVARTIRVISQTALSGSKVSIPVELTSNGNELAAAITLDFDPTTLSNPVIELAKGIPSDAVLTTNTTAAEKGKIVILVDSSAALSIAGRAQQIIIITFDVRAGAEGKTEVSFGTSAAVNSVADTNGNLLPTTFVNGSVTILPAKAQISGRVVTSDGVGIRNASVTLTDIDGVLRSASTGSFGYYLFDGVSVERSVSIAVISKRYRFDQQNINATAGSSDVNFVAKE
jgi:hypothetical protein